MRIIAVCLIFGLAACGAWNNKELAQQEETRLGPNLLDSFAAGTSKPNFFNVLQYQTNRDSVVVAFAGDRDAGPMIRCGTKDNKKPNAERAAKNDSFFFMLNDTLHISTIVHVIYNDRDDGKLSLTEVNEQMVVLNRVFNQYKIAFHRDNLIYTENNDYFIAGLDSNGLEDPNSVAMKTNLAVNPKEHLNIYINDCDLLGYATFPWHRQDNPQLDGVVISYGTIPDGWQVGADEGMTLVHEVGHYFGLFHTFEGGCQHGDLVDDTEPQEYDYTGCPVGRNTCGGPRPDPVHNFMGYTDDACMNHFTAGQLGRMFWAIARHRPEFLQVPATNGADLFKIERARP